MTNAKFRAWDTQAKKYVRIDSIQFDHLGNGEPVTIKVDDAEWSIKRFVLEQWTGLKDKNGREIYEGDIVAFGVPLKNKKIAAVEWKNIGWNPFLTELMDEWAEVMGNIHENPELLK